MVDEIVAVFAPVPAGTVARRHARWRRSRRGAPRTLPATVRPWPRSRPVTLLPRLRERLRGFGGTGRDVGAPPLGPTPRDRHGQSLWSTPLSGALFDLGFSSPQLHRLGARLPLPCPRSARHADGPDGREVGMAADIVNGYDVDRAGGAGCCASSATSGSRSADRPGDRRRPTDRDARRSCPRSSSVAIPAATCAHRAVTPRSGPSRRCGSSSTASWTSSPAALDQAIDVTAPGRASGRADVPLRRGPTRQAALRRGRQGRLHVPARTAVRVRRGRRPCAGFAAPGRHRPSRPTATGAPARPACGSSRSSGQRHERLADASHRCPATPSTGIPPGAFGTTEPLSTAAVPGSRCSAVTGTQELPKRRPSSNRSNCRWCRGGDWQRTSPPSPLSCSESSMLSAVVLHTRLAERQRQIDQLEQQVDVQHDLFDTLRQQRAVPAVADTPCQPKAPGSACSRRRSRTSSPSIHGRWPRSSPPPAAQGRWTAFSSTVTPSIRSGAFGRRRHSRERWGSGAATAE